MPASQTPSSAAAATTVIFRAWALPRSLLFSSHERQSSGLIECGSVSITPFAFPVSPEQLYSRLRERGRLRCKRRGRSAPGFVLARLGLGTLGVRVEGHVRLGEYESALGVLFAAPLEDGPAKQ